MSEFRTNLHGPDLPLHGLELLVIKNVVLPYNDSKSCLFAHIKLLSFNKPNAHMENLNFQDPWFV